MLMLICGMLWWIIFMKTVVQFNQLFVVSEKFGKCFIESFSPRLNIIGGRNTAGKSTLLQSLIYVFGVNDVKQNLGEILKYDPVFRLDFLINGREYKIIRDMNSIYIEDYTGRTTQFNGVNADNSIAHIKLKDRISDLINFNLMLEQKGEIKKASLECTFLPYYVSQSVGWVYLRESFSNLGFYKGFKDDFLDYYLGVNNNFNKEKYIKLNDQIKELSYDIKSLNNFTKKSEYVFSAFMDEHFGNDANQYLDGYINDNNELQEERRSYINFSNKLALLNNHKKILIKTKNNLKKQKYDDVDRCPACTQVLKYSLEGLYSFYQKVNDTIELEEQIKNDLKEAYSNVNNTQKRIEYKEKMIDEKYKVLGENIHGNMSFDEWIKGKANLQLHKKIKSDLNDKIKEKDMATSRLKNMGADEDVFRNRKIKEKTFSSIFKKYLIELGVNNLNEDRYLELYRINSFPYQGVELHKTVMAYHFAFNKLISETENIHRLPFLLDGVLKEDIDQTSLNDIFSFIGKNLPVDTQTFISIAEHVKDDAELNNSVKSIDLKVLNSQYFDGKANNIYIGDGVKQRAFFQEELHNFQELYADTLRIIADV